MSSPKPNPTKNQQPFFQWEISKNTNFEPWTTGLWLFVGYMSGMKSYPVNRGIIINNDKGAVIDQPGFNGMSSGFFRLTWFHLEVLKMLGGMNRLCW